MEIKTFYNNKFKFKKKKKIGLKKLIIDKKINMRQLFSNYSKKKKILKIYSFKRNLFFLNFTRTKEKNIKKKNIEIT
jgi:hypothetical protein